VKIIAVVEMNDGEAFVLDQKPDLKYTKYGFDTIVGIDEPFLSCYYHQTPIPPKYDKSFPWQAFAGRKFDLPLTDGTVEHCYGQWWWGITKSAKEQFDDEIITVTACDKESLRKCYVFGGYQGLEKGIQKMRSEYTGKVYGYWEYQKFLKEEAA